MFRCYSYTTIRERISLCLLKLLLSKWTILATVTLVSTINALPDDGVTVTPEHIGAVLM